MTLGDPYVTTAELKVHLGITDTGDDVRIGRAVNSASRNLEKFCRRQFNTDNAVSTRRFRSATGMRAVVDDFHTTSGLVVRVGSLGSFTTTLTLDSDFFVGPVEAPYETPDVWPFWRLRGRQGNWPFTCRALSPEEPNLEVDANWGWASVPPDIVDAAMLHATRLYRRKDSPEGVIVDRFQEAAAVRLSARMDPDAVRLASPFRKHRPGRF